MKNIVTLLSCTVLAACFGASGIETPNIYSDQRALRVDDILTIVINENAQAGSESSTNTDKEHDMDVSSGGGSGLLKLLPKFGASGGSKITYDGAGSTSRKGSLEATISARVVKVLDNGNLVIEGSKSVEVNEEKEIIKISGIVRPLDIQRNNIVSSAQIADAQITYSGKGVASTGQRPGILARIFNWIF